jgi:autonomous glycyl radical cofactor GrcA
LKNQQINNIKEKGNNMGNFCKYCGNSIQEGGECSCQEAKQMAEATFDTNKVIDSNLGSNSKEQVNKVDNVYVKNTISMMKKYFLDVLCKPVSALEEAVKETEKLPQLLFGLVYAVVLFLCFTIRLSDIIHSAGTLVLLPVAFLLFKVIYAGIGYLFAKKQGYDFASILSLFCLITIPESVGILAVFILSYFLSSLYSLFIIILIVLYIISIILGMITYQIIFNYDKDKCVFIFILSSFIVTIVEGVVIRQAITAIVQSIMSNMGNIMGSFF